MVILKVVFCVQICFTVMCYSTDSLGGGGGSVNTYADPWVFEGLLSSDSLGWVNRQHLVDQVLRLGGHSVPLWRWELRIGETSRCINRMTFLVS